LDPMPAARVGRARRREEEDLLFVAIGPNEAAAGAEGLGEGPAERLKGGALEIELGLEARLPGMAPVDMPALVHLEADAGVEGLAGPDLVRIQDELRLHPVDALVQSALARGFGARAGGEERQGCEDREAEEEGAHGGNSSGAIRRRLGGPSGR